MTCKIPVLALTSFAMEGGGENLISGGCAGYISKPIETRTFIRTLESYLVQS